MDIKSIIDAIRGYMSKPNEADAAKAGAQAIASKLPEAVMPHQGLKEAQRRRDMMDKQTEE